MKRKRLATDKKKDKITQRVLSIVENIEQELIEVKHLVAQLQEMRKSNDEMKKSNNESESDTSDADSTREERKSEGGEAPMVMFARKVDETLRRHMEK